MVILSLPLIDEGKCKFVYLYQVQCTGNLPLGGLCKNIVARISINLLS